MSHYDFCRQNVGRPVKIVTHDGIVHRGIIRRVNPSKVFIDPFDARRGAGGYGYGFFGYGRGLGIGIALGAIATIAFLPFFFW
ncbi:hypothetical protein [Gracilibacillus thailandensis]|jgi:hypothetical protein|uniref:Uncharacterized protein n=1 Tax=Gracilibacillus thailandensis TaxID=563735 RepID=A0A6N7QUR6_9BACI|nr:hypothetical protein [Gracilibacillus thailandensis]MRI64872.1 hypothetical protein [Gracilibacillus thailandensis]